MAFPRHVISGSTKPSYGGGQGGARQNRDYVIGLLCAVMLLQSAGLVSVLLLRSPSEDGGVDGGLSSRVEGALRSSGGGGGGGSPGRRRMAAQLESDPTNGSFSLDLQSIPGMSDALSEADSFHINGSKSYVVFVTANDGMRTGVVAMGRADSHDGAGAALVKAQTELGRLWKLRGGFEGAEPRYVKVDVVSSVRKVKDFDIRKDEVDTSGVGVRGLAFDWEKGWAFTPDEVMAGTLLDKKHRVRLDKVVETAANRGGGDMVAFPWPEDEDVRKDDTIEMFQTFRTESVFIDLFGAEGNDGSSAAKLAPVFRGHQAFETADYDTLMESAKLAGDYLVDKVDENGVFLYSYLPKSDSQVDESQYSITRHAGTVYAMALLYERTGKKDKKLINAAKRALDYLISDDASAMVKAPHTGEESLCAIDKRHPDGWCCKLGSNGLTVLALAKYVEAAGDIDNGKYVKAAGLYAKWIDGAQRKDGTFVHKQEFPSGELDLKKYCRYYPGEAIFGLTQLYKLDSDERWLDVAEKAGKQMIADTKDDPTNDHWLLYGLRELHLVRPNPDQIEHSMKLTMILHNAHEDDTEVVRDLAGAYDHDTSICSTATKTEGMCAAYELAKANGLEDDAARILADTELGALYQIRAQFRPEGTLHLPNPRRAIGGFKADIENWEVRIDYVQHSLSGLVCLAKALETEGRRDS